MRKLLILLLLLFRLRVPETSKSDGFLVTRRAGDAVFELTSLCGMFTVELLSKVSWTVITQAHMSMPSKIHKNVQKKCMYKVKTQKMP